MLTALKRAVLEANLRLAHEGLAPLTWGNASGIDRGRGLVVIKPSGVPYHDLTAEAMVVVDLDGNVVAGSCRPSTDTPTHVQLYRAFAAAGGIVHTHSPHATAFAQALREIPLLGTTHADHFRGPIPVTRALTPSETADAYEANTAAVIVERFAAQSPVDIPGVLVAHHGPFAWGRDTHAAVDNAVALEGIARMALLTLQLGQAEAAIPAHLAAKHFRRKHGPDAYYGPAPDGSGSTTSASSRAPRGATSA